MQIGYVRVSTDDQKLDLQMDAMRKAGCEQVYRDVASGAKEQRKGLHRALSFMRKGDTLVVWKLDRLGRSLRHLIDVVNDLNDRGERFYQQGNEKRGDSVQRGSNSSAGGQHRG
ncbi:MAG: hypothetical protein GF364_19170 [Candidatus Lokiarchaeota archaeon]|nr:hypothetical protein [Candidatus Lokiarchaeota archaeon]